ncbi:MAG: sigma-70 family RNA polymerase sigma factor [Ruminiclostridium sp.]|nr:sigma-70 family RNA polymerase sigma factor [Ruminiclostridium sp.]
MTSDYSSDSIRELYLRNFDTLYRVSFMYLKNAHDAEDAVHNAFLKAIETRKRFESEKHEKAWLIRVASNICKNMLKAASRKNEPLSDNIPDSCISGDAKDLLYALSDLPDNLKIPVYLFYYDGYSSDEIGQMLHITPSAVRSRLQKARELLRNVLSDERSVE